MDKETLNNMPEYVKNLPKAVQDLVFDGAWEERTAEIAKKYSLNDIQTDDLINTVLFVLIGLESPDTFLQTIITELGISRLLAEQIMEDLEVRVFEYALKQVESSKSKVESKDNRPKATPSVFIPKVPFGMKPEIAVEKPKVLEIKPDNQSTPDRVLSVGLAGLPMVEKGEIVHINQPPKPISTPVEVRPSQEQVQRPVSVPRFTAVPMEEESQVEEKLTDDTATETVSPIPKVEPVKPEHKYTIDPYREPLE